MLRDAQKTLADWIRAPEGVAAALAEADADRAAESEPSARRRLRALVRSDETLDAVGRLEIYANAYFHRILGVLGEDYPALSRAMGSDAFHDMVTSYLLVEPSRHPSLRYAGGRLPGFLASHDAASGLRARTPWAADLAALEWARVEVFDAPDGVLLTREVLAGISPDSFASLELRLGAWARILSLDHPVDTIWRSATGDGEVASPASEPTSTHMLVWRKDERVVHRNMTAFEVAGAVSAMDGVCFGQLCESAAGLVGDDEAPALSAAWLEQWLADGILCSSAESTV